MAALKGEGAVDPMHKPDWPTFTRMPPVEPFESGAIRQAAVFNRNLKEQLWGHASTFANILD